MLPPPFRHTSITPTKRITVRDKVKFVYNSYELWLDSNHSSFFTSRSEHDVNFLIVKKVKQFRYRPAVGQRVPGS